MATSSLGTYRNAIKPVGEQIIADYNNSSNLEIGDSVEWDYSLSSNYIVTDLEIIKTSVAAGANTFLVEIIRVQNDGTETVIVAQEMAALSATGTVLRASSPAAPVVGLFENGSSGSIVNRLIGIKSQSAGATPSSNSSQSLRVRITSATARSTPGQSACLIRICLSRFSDIQSLFDESVTIG